MFTCKNANCYLENPVRRTDTDDFHQMTSASVGRICWICQSAEFRVTEDCADPATASNTSMSAKHSHSMFILSRGDMVKHMVDVCVYTCMRCVCVCACVPVCAVNL